MPNEINSWRGVPIEEFMSSLPFAPQSLKCVSENSDFAEFLWPFTIPLGEDESALFKHYIHEHNLNNQALGDTYETINTGVESTIINAVKHVFTYDRMLVGLLEEDMVNGLGLPYLIESSTDLECSVFLFATGKYQKQSLQMLRNALETAVTHAYFSCGKRCYDEIRTEKVPSMNAKKSGMLPCLKECGLIGNGTYNELSLLYRLLSKATHSQFEFLNTKFEEIDELEYVSSWASYVEAVSISCIKLVLNLLRADVH